jgi:hypothetical protein
VTTGVYSILPMADLYGRAVLYICLRRHNPNTRQIDETFRCVVWFLDMFFRDHVLRTHYMQVTIRARLANSANPFLVFEIQYSSAIAHVKQLSHLPLHLSYFHLVILPMTLLIPGRLQILQSICFKGK